MVEDVLEVENISGTARMNVAATARGRTVGDLRKTLDVFRNDDRKLLKEVERMDDTVDQLHEAIKLYVIRVSREQLDNLYRALTAHPLVKYVL